MDEKALGRKLQLARKRAGLTQQELCQKAGLSYSTLAKIERGAIKAPSVFTVAHIAVATNTPLEELLELEARGIGSAPESDKKRSKNGVRFVYFDVNGTLVRFYERAFTEISKAANVPVEILETIFLHYDGAACRGSMSSEEVESIIGSQIGLPDFKWSEYYLGNVEPTPGSAELLAWAAKNYEVGLLTNNWLGFTDDLISRHVMPSLDYKAIVESAKAGCSKPESKIYEIAQELSGARPEEILLIDDNQAYLAGAEKAGWHTMWFEETRPEASFDRIRETLAF